MDGQISLFDWMPSAQPEPPVGSYIQKPGAIIPHIMRKGYIGRKIAFDCSTESREMYRIGILEEVKQASYFHLEDGRYVEKPCDHVTIYDGVKQRSYILLMPGHEIFECLPWHAYERR